MTVVEVVVVVEAIVVVATALDQILRNGVLSLIDDSKTSRVPDSRLYHSRKRLGI